MLTKGAIGNLVNRYRAVLAKCNLINTFGSLAVASMLVLGGAGVAGAADTTIGTAGATTNMTKLWIYNGNKYINENSSTAEKHETFNLVGDSINFESGSAIYIVHNEYYPKDKSATINLGTDNTNDININFGNQGIYAVYADTTVNVKGKYLNLVSTSENSTRGIQASNSDMTPADRAARVFISKDTDTYIKVNDKSYAILTFSGGIVDIQGNLTIDSTNAVVTRGNSKITINESGEKTVKITGDILFDPSANTPAAGANSEVSINLTNDQSYLNGAVYVSDNSLGLSAEDVSGMNMGISNGAKWTAPKDSFVSNLALDGGNVNIPAGVDIAAANTTGNGNINMEDAEDLGSFTAGNADGAELNVHATDKDGNVKNADDVDAATLKKMQAQVKAVDATVTASAPEGDVNGAISIDKNGNAKQAKNTLMDAALKQASVASISLDRILTNDVRKRMGDIRADQNQSGVWMRWDGGKLKGNGLTNDFNTIQIGADTKVAKNCRLGLAGSFTHGDTDFARGNGELEGFSFAAYATWMGENGMFADVVARLGHFSTEMNVEGRSGDMDNRVASLSGEYGWRFNVCDQFFVEPQVEVAYTYVSSEDLELGTAQYHFDNVDSLTGRAGLVFGWNLPDDRGNVYARASVLQQFMGDAKISGVNGAAHNVQEIDGDDTWLEYGLGANIKLTDKTYVWADVERTEGAEIEEEWRGTVGVRFSF